jgi:predicted PurR-regulated permease PerM
MSMPMDSQPGPRDPWSRGTKDTWFFLALGASTVSVLWLLSPFIYVLIFAVVVVVVTWPFYERMLARVRGRRALASILTTLLLGFVLFGPLGLVVALFVQQAIAVVQIAVDWVQAGKLQRLIDQGIALPHSSHVPPWVDKFIPEDFDLEKTVSGPLKDGTLAILNAAGSAVPNLVHTTVEASIDASIFLFTILALYIEGPRVLKVLKNLSPMDDAYEERLFEVFREFSNNLVVGALATAIVQGIIAGIGYWIAGVDRVLFFAILTGVLSFVPVVGTALIWIPLAILTAVEGSLFWGIFVAGWSMVFTTHVDSFVRPLFMRGSTNIHPLLIFLSAFGGMAWMGVPGALVGPVLMAFFMALYTIYAEDYLGQPREAAEPGHVIPLWLQRLVLRAKDALIPPKAEPAPAPAVDAPPVTPIAAPQPPADVPPTPTEPVRADS